MNSGLSLPDTMGVSGLVVGAQRQQEIHLQHSTTEDIIQQLTHWGYPVGTTPTYTCPSVTPDMLANMDNKNYTEVYAKHVEWLNYTENVYARVKCKHRDIDAELRTLDTEIRKEASAAAGKKPSKDALDVLVKAHPRYQAVLLDQQKVRNQEELLEAHVNRLTRMEKLISRSIELRKETLEGNRIAGNIQNRSPAPYGTQPRY